MNPNFNPRAPSQSKLIASGPNAQYHTEKYVLPFKGKDGSHFLAYPTEPLDFSVPVSIVDYEVVDDKYHAIVKQGNTTITVQYSKLHKPYAPQNLGFEYETLLVKTLKSNGLMPKDIEAAGATSGHDFILQRNEEIFHGEVKKSREAAFGQLTVHYTKSDGWHISDKNRSNRPRYAEQVEEHVLPELNEVDRDGVTTNVTFNFDNLEPASAYLKDHDVDVLHVCSHGTYSVGKDKTGLGLPEFKGTNGSWRARKKHKHAKINSLTVQFQPGSVFSFEKSPVNLEDESQLPEIRKKFK